MKAVAPPEGGTPSGWRALVVEDDALSCEALVALLELEGFAVETAEGMASARALLAPQPSFDVAFVDFGLPDGDGMELVPLVASLPMGCAVVVLTGERRLERAVEAMRRGAADYLTKPLDGAALQLALHRLRHALGERDEQRRLARELMRHGGYMGLIGKAPPMVRVFEQVLRAGPTELPVFVRGESGTGKELLARAIHQASRRRSGPFVAINCGAIPAQLAESELFGHERGSFTGADRMQVGAFTRANKGTLFLDELTEMPLELQVILLRALEAGVIQRVGGSRELPIDVRVVAATNRDPEEAVRAGRLRQDLYFRLQVIPIALPPLRERTADVPLLAQHFLEGGEGPTVTLSAAARQALMRHAWPGNVRELKNAIARARVFCTDDVIEPRDLALPAADAGAPAETPRAEAHQTGARPVEDAIAIPPTMTLAGAERRLVEAQLRRQSGNRARTAEVLGIAPKTLYNKLKAWGIGAPDDG